MHVECWILDSWNVKIFRQNSKWKIAVASTANHQQTLTTIIRSSRDIQRERVNVVGMWGMENLIILLKVHGLYTTASVLCFNTLKYFIYKHTKNSIFMYLIFNFHILYNNSSSTAPKKKKTASCEFKYKRLYSNQENIFIFFLFKNRRHNLTMNK